MIVVIVGGHDRMVCQYKGICKEYGCKAKVYTQAENNLEGLIGRPDLIVLFTNPVSHKMAIIARKMAAYRDIAIVQSHCGSGSALRNILSENLISREESV
ncbi:MAG: DUF2325 domain-containing protein [Clostridiales bacterium]|jgi:hypothetical protein|nr:DUF2325 domain-containing protein [Clostridiales bacterium]